ncbi:LysR substrate-binding domain-containing protein [Arenibaculum pallidiluteum]|uniref:LysR substrate-binding domain-containing protein n=1 Tax=Arenibaculum pallidiluteum TaxID=2812559 RepID=UPI001A96A8AD|nr:LysR substrate-binding domain-containing protein [Arenibaculum pallidiluteum]
MVPLRAIVMFQAAVRAGSLASAAQELGVTPSAISQQVRSLEEYLGTSLMGKDGRTLKLTEAGERFYDMIAGSIDAIFDATQALRGYRAVSRLTIRAAPSLAAKWLMPRLSAFVDAHPQFEVRVDGTNEPTNFDREDVDVEIRHGEGRWSGLFVEGLAEERFLPMCSPNYAAAGSLSPRDLLDRRLIHSVKSQVQWRHWFGTAGMTPDRRWERVLFDRSHMVIDAAADGLGIALESELLAWRELRDGRLVCPVTEPPKVVVTTQWIVCPHERLRLSKVKTFIEWVRAERDDWLREVEASRRPNLTIVKKS